jgi:hypothetical protein
LDIDSKQYNSYYKDAEGKWNQRVGATTNGLSTDGKVSVITLNSTTWTALPTVSLSNRNAIAIQNDSSIEIKINYDSNVTGYVGMTVKAGAERFYNITDSITLYAKSASGTPDLNVEELA